MIKRVKKSLRKALSSSAIAQEAIGKLYRATEYGRLKNIFIENGNGHRYDRAARQELVRQFEIIDREVPIASSPVEGLALAEMVMQLDAPGDVVECGCYSGGSTAKLSLVAKLSARKVVVFDSFEGLPEVDQYNLDDHHARRGSGWTTSWSKGRYAARRDFVEANVRRFGAVSVCSFIEGWFENTLTPSNLAFEIGLAFVDVDIPSSARQCFDILWPRLPAKGVFVTHDTAYLKVLKEFMVSDAWDRTGTPPLIIGSGFGLGDTAPHVGFMVKGEIDPDYIKSLTLERT